MASGDLRACRSVLLAFVLAMASIACTGNKNAATSGPGLRTAGQRTGPTGWIDGLDGERRVGGTLHVQGWAAESDDGAPVQKIEVTVDGRVVALANRMNLERPDVVAASYRDSWLNSGWRAEVPITDTVPGWHRLAAVAYDWADKSTELGGAVQIQLLAGQ